MKRKKIIKAVLSLIIITFLFNDAFAWLSRKDKGTSGAQFLKIGLGSVGPALGGAYTALSSDVSGLYWNPSGIAFISKSQIELMHLIWFEDTSLQYLGFTTGLGQGRLGLSYSGLRVGELERRSSDTAEPEGKFEAKNQSIGISYALRKKNNAFGVSVKYISSKIDEWTASGAAIDLGYRREMGKYLLGISLRNLGTRIKFENKADPLPTSLNIGIGIKVKDNMLLSADFNLPNDNIVNAAIGYEYRLILGSFNIPLRVGYRTLNEFGIKDSLSAGIGVESLDNYSFDIAWVPHGLLGDTVRISLKGSF